MTESTRSGAAIQASEPNNPPESGMSTGSYGVGQIVRRSLRAPMRIQSYRNLLYLALMFPLGFIYFHLLLFGFTFGTGLSVVLIGLPIILLTLIVVSGLASFERLLARVLLGVDIPVSSVEADQTAWGRTKALVTDRQVWGATVYLLSEFVAGIAVFSLLSSLVLTAGSLMLTPLYYQHASTNIYLGPAPVIQFAPDVLFGWDNLLVGLQTTVVIDAWQVAGLAVALLVALVGAALMLVTLLICNVFARFWGQYMSLMLRTPRYWNTDNW